MIPNIQYYLTTILYNDSFDMDNKYFNMILLDEEDKQPDWK